MVDKLETVLGVLPYKLAHLLHHLESQSRLADLLLLVHLGQRPLEDHVHDGRGEEVPGAPELLQHADDEIHEAGGGGAALELGHLTETGDQGQRVVAVEAELPDEDEGDHHLVGCEAVAEEGGQPGGELLDGLKTNIERV